jgi:lipoate-protein ligase A
MALDEAISEAVRKKMSPPTLRLYSWNAPSLSIGYFQKASDIDIEYCDKNNYPVVRRMTGGRAILHDAELTYSISSPLDSSVFRNSLMENYTIISNALVSAFQANGINAESSFKRKKNSAHKNAACFRSVSYGEITVNGKKIIGSAQKRFSSGFLQHGSILLDFNAAELGRTLKYNGKEGFNEIGSIKEHCPGISLAGLKRSLKEAFESDLKIKMVSDTPNKFELDLAKELETNKYSTREWNFRR